MKSCRYAWEIPVLCLGRWIGSKLSYQYPNYLKLKEGIKLYPWLLKY
jgi:hypothetical protein